MPQAAFADVQRPLPIARAAEVETVVSPSIAGDQAIVAAEFLAQAVVVAEGISCIANVDGRVWEVQRYGATCDLSLALVRLNRYPLQEHNAERRANADPCLDVVLHKAHAPPAGRHGKRLMDIQGPH